MSDDLLDCTREVFSALPVDAQARFDGQWGAAFSVAQSRHFSSPDPEQKEAVESLARLFFVHGYMAAVAAEKERMGQTRRAIERLFAEYMGRL